MADNELVTEAVTVLTELLKLLDVTATITPAETAEDEKAVLNIACEDSARLIGAHGRTLEAIELLMNRILRKNHKEDESTSWILLSVDGYQVEAPRHSRDEGDGERRGRRGRPGRISQDEEERLRAMAKDIAHEVKKLGKSRVIGPFAPGERRIIHLALENDPDVETVSDAEADANRGKKITIQLKNQQG